jgi:hypothetical protein
VYTLHRSLPSRLNDEIVSRLVHQHRKKSTYIQGRAIEKPALQRQRSKLDVFVVRSTIRIVDREEVSTLVRGNLLYFVVMGDMDIDNRHAYLRTMSTNLPTYLSSYPSCFPKCCASI